jgi:cell division septum initiation protein DivIVA
MRGYDRGLVDDSIRDFRKELINLTNLNNQLATELREAQNRLIELETDAQEAKSPSYAGVGAKAAQILSNAEELALRLVSDAEAERKGVLDGVNAELEQQKADGQDYYEELVSEAQRRSERILNSAKADYDETLAKAQVEAQRIIEEATREAGAIRGAVSTEVARMRATAKREIEVKEANSARELAERRLILERQLTQPITPTLTSAVLSEQERIDLDLELTARRAEAEATYQRKYQEAVAQTQRYLDDANAQLSTALTKVATARLEAETLEAGARSINKATTEEARNKAEDIIVAAEGEARAILASTQAKVKERLHVMESAERKLAQERESIMVYLGNLKQVIDQVSKDVK